MDIAATSEIERDRETDAAQDAFVLPPSLGVLAEPSSQESADEPEMASQEPAFALQGFPATVQGDLLRNITCACASAKLLLLGYQDGSVALFDVFGYLVEHHTGRHAAPVTTVALGAGSTDDDVAASAAADGSFRTSTLFDNSAQSTTAVLSSRAGIRSRASVPLVAIAVDPEYGKPRVGERVAHANSDGRLVLFQSGWFGGSETVICKPDGRVQSMCWTGYLLAWATCSGVKIYDTRLGQTVCAVESPVASLQPPVSGALVIPDETFGTSDYSDPGAVGSPKSPAGSTAEIETPKPPSSWEWKTSLRFEVDEDEELSAHGERTQTLYVAWPSAAKVIVIGPHIDPPKGAASPKNPPSNPDEAHPTVAPRVVETTLSIGRSELPVDGDAGAESLASPILGIAPFGNAHITLLVGTIYHGLVLVRVPNQWDESTPGVDRDILCMRLPQGSVRMAELHPIVGGEPYVLVVAHMMEEEEDGLLPSNEQQQATVAGEVTVGITEVAEGSIVGTSSPPSTPGGASIDEPGEGTELIISPRRQSIVLQDEASALESSCVIFARTLGVAERIKWMLEHGMFEAAVTLAEEAPRGSLRRADVSIADVGDQFLDSIRVKGDFKRLAEVLPRIIVSTSPSVAIRGYDNVMRVRSTRWQEWVDVFNRANKLDLIATSVPSFEPRLSDALYNDVLIDLADANPPVMLQVLKTWPADVYDVAIVTRAVEVQSAMLNGEQASGTGNGPAREAVREALFMLYGLSGRHDETLALLLRERSDRVFNYIKSHDLYEAVRSDEAIRGLYTVDVDQATDLFVNAPGTLLPPESVVPILNSVGNRAWLCSYLYAVFKQDPERAAQYHGLLLEVLVAHGAPGTLYMFLKTSSHFSLDAALKLMGGRNGKGKGVFGRERVFVLATMGDLNAAMDILLRELRDVHGAIDFASEHGDKALWDRLIEHGREDANTLAALLDSPAGGRVNPVRLIPLIAEDMHIPHLRDRLHRILVDAALERALREETAAALHFDAGKLMCSLDEAVTSPGSQTNNI